MLSLSKHLSLFSRACSPQESLPYRLGLAYSAAMNRLLFGDNLKWPSDTKIFPDASVNLVYLYLPLAYEASS